MLHQEEPAPIGVVVIFRVREIRDISEVRIGQGAELGQIDNFGLGSKASGDRWLQMKGGALHPSEP
ncbi:hypothetical protein D3C81_2264730 [compost metagenome]